MLTVMEVATRLKLSRRAVYRAVELGDLEHHRFGASIRVSESQLEAFLDRSRVHVHNQEPNTRALVRKHLDL
jgi:excisionase family DNA binding protein